MVHLGGRLSTLVWSACRGSCGQTRGYSQSSQLLKKWADKVNSFGRLNVTLPCSLTISGSGSSFGGSGNSVSVRVTGSTEQTDWLRVASDIVCIRTDDEDGTLVSIAVADNVDLRATHGVCAVNVDVPSQYDLSLDVRNGPVKVSGIESSSVNISLANGDCDCVSLKADDITIHATDGNVILRKSTIGNVDIKVHNGVVTADKLQGQHVSVGVLGCGNVSSASLYAITANLSAEEGNIAASSCHGDITAVTGVGDIKLKSVEGNLTAAATSGNIDVYLVQHNEVSLRCDKGNITVRLPETAATTFDLKAARIDIDDDLMAVETHCHQDSDHIIMQGHIGPSEKTTKSLSAAADQGIITLSASSWFAAQTS